MTVKIMVAVIFCNEKGIIVTLISKLNAVSGRSGQGSPHLQVPVVCRYSLSCGRLLSAVPLGLKQIVTISNIPASLNDTT